jgi:hypothetical protein
MLLRLTGSLSLLAAADTATTAERSTRCGSAKGPTPDQTHSASSRRTSPWRACVTSGSAATNSERPYRTSGAATLRSPRCGCTFNKQRQHGHVVSRHNDFVVTELQEQDDGATDSAHCARRNHHVRGVLLKQHVGGGDIWTRRCLAADAKRHGPRRRRRQRQQKNYHTARPH